MNSNADPPQDPFEASVAQLITTYHELNSETIEELSEQPSALEFMRYVARNRPFVVRRGAANWPACRKWSFDYFNKELLSAEVSVAQTPNGRADAPDYLPDGTLCFVKPYYHMDEDKINIVREIHDQEVEHQKGESRYYPVYYAQTQDNNLRAEYPDLFPDVPESIPFARIALQQKPDAVNVWIGNSLSTTALHKDNYENIYVQILGKKHFVLLPPVEAPCVNEQELPAATYQPRYLSADSGLSAATATPEFSYKLFPQLDDRPERVTFPIWDPDEPDLRTTPFSHLSRPMRVTLDEGDMLYLPALWYHKVSQSCYEKDRLCMSVNYWYDMDFGGSFWSLCNFARSVGLAASAEGNRFGGRSQKLTGAEFMDG